MYLARYSNLYIIHILWALPWQVVVYKLPLLQLIVPDYIKSEMLMLVFKVQDFQTDTVCMSHPQYIAEHYQEVMTVS